MAAQEPLITKTDKSFRDAITSVDGKGERVFFHPKKPKGRYWNARKIVSYVLLALMFSGPFIRVNGHPFMLFNLLEREFILFGVAFWPQDFKILVLGFITLVVFIVLFTAVFGRLFCGWICPQTIFMEMLFRRIEYWIDGDYQAQKKLAASDWTPEKIRKRGIKFAIFFAISFFIANIFLAYLVGSDELFKMISEPLSQHAGSFVALVLFTGVFFFVYWWFREQACTIVCPYGRLQGVLLDRNSLNVAYDFVRGEPRGKHGRKRDESLGDCIDCNQCVVVCPTGIDIRNGTQLECVNCTACIDACDEVMDKVGKPRGLIRYASENSIVAKVRKVFTPRVVIYSALLGILLVLFGYLLTTRTITETSILRARGQMSVLQADGSVKNLYMVKTINKSFNALEVSYVLREPVGRLQLVGQNFTVPPQGYREGAVFVILESAQLTAPQVPIIIDILHNGEVVETVKTSFNTSSTN
jgi:cytochrome c oxidase accessory protein FixG